MVLCKIDYNEDAGKIVVSVDFNGDNWESFLAQRDKDNRKLHPACYESSFWSKMKCNYDAIKQECKEMLYILKKLKIWLIRMHFVMKTNANTLVAQLNGAAYDHSSAMLTCWLTWIRLFNFEVRHVKGATYTAANFLFKKLKHFKDTESNTAEENNNEN